ncbi:hypothetical protein K2173_004370 [Erythroxylum novogranatense]|uniref:Uncharacterized protein n=1 Tax=Erythroxylum novogranatense TaxID=1862640 RepID=A0AAV8T680_9ROSI|nr:hypothetical protein K2173_004370 [Erythroxylum novogranatense]
MLSLTMTFSPFPADHDLQCSQGITEGQNLKYQVPLLAGAEEETYSNAPVKGKIKRFAIFLYEKLKFNQILQLPIIVSWWLALIIFSGMVLKEKLGII